MRGEELLENRQKKVLVMLKEHGDTGLTQPRLKYLTKWGRAQIVICMTELEKEGKIIVRQAGGNRLKTYVLAAYK